MFTTFRRARRSTSISALAGACALALIASSMGQPVAALGAPAAHPARAPRGSAPSGLAPARAPHGSAAHAVPPRPPAPRRPVPGGPVVNVAAVPNGPAQNVQVTTAAGSATLTWGAADWGSSTNQTYTVLVNGNPVASCTSISALTCRVTGGAGAQVTLVVRALGDTPASEYSDAGAITTTLLPPPDAPTITGATASGSNQATVTWTAPASWHLSTNKTYSVLVDNAVYPSCTNITALTCTFLGASGVRAVKVRAIGNTGLQTDSAPTNVTLVTAPDKPTNIHLTSSDAGTGTIAWDAPNWHGSTNQQYTVTVDGDPVAGCTASTLTTCSFSADAISVQVVVTAIGDSSNLTTASDPVTLTLLPPPDAPTGIQDGSWAVGSTVIQWQPVDFNGSTHNGYTVTADGNPVSGCVDIAATTCTLAGTPDTAPQIVVTAIGDAGLSQASAGTPVELPALPDAPTSVHATTWSSSGTRVSWTAPVGWHHNTHSPHYSVSVAGVTACASTTNTYCDVTTGADSASQVTVSAIGDSPSVHTDATATIDLPGMPDTPTDIHSTATGAGTATIAWTEPNWRHNTVNQTFAVTVDGSPVMCNDATVASCDISGVGPVDVTVQAIGNDPTLSSAASAPVSFPLIAAPSGSVTSVTVAAVGGGSHEVDVTWPRLTDSSGDWEAGTEDGYQVAISGPGGAVIGTGSCGSTVTDPMSGTVSCSFSTDTDGSYTVRVTAVNEAGPSSTYREGTAALVVNPPAGGVSGLTATSTGPSHHVAVQWSQITSGAAWHNALTRAYTVTIDKPDGATLSSDTCTGSGDIVDGVSPSCSFDTNTWGSYTIHVKPKSEGGTGTTDTTATLTVSFNPPAAPVTVLQATSAAGSGIVQVTWTGLGADDWQGDTHHYDVTVNGPGGQVLSNNTCTVLGTSDATGAGSCSFSTDTGGSYTVTVTPHNESGAGTPATSSPVIVSTGSPTGPVSNLQLSNTPPAGLVNVTWNQLAPAAWKGASSRNYTVTVTGVTTSGSTCTTVADSGSPGCSFTATSAGDYQVTVVPTTEAGSGSSTGQSGHIVLNAPSGVVTNLHVSTTPGSGVVNLTWDQLPDAGWSQGQAGNRQYAVTVTGVTTTGGNCTSVADSASPSCSFTATTAGPFTVTVKAVNEAGTAASGTSDSSGNIVFRPAVAVTSLTAAQNIVTSPTVQVSWDSLQAADWQGGASKKYRVTVTPPSGQVTSDLCEAHDIDDSGSPSCTFDAGVGGDYGITVKPVNEAGLSTASAASASVHVVVVPTVTVTGLHVVTTPGSPDVTVVWNRATDFNGAVSTHNYLVTLTSPDGASLSNNDCTTVVDSTHPLCGFTTTVGGTYTASVALANEAGTGPSSATSSAVLALLAPTAAVTNLTVSSTPGSGTVQVGWTGLGAGSWQGSTRHYNVAVTSAPNGANLSSNTCTVLASSDATAATGCSFATDTAGDYTVTVTAANEAGTSSSVATQSGHVTLVAPTGPVANLQISAPAGNPTVTATWNQLAAGSWQSGATKTYTVVVTSPNGANLTNNTCTSVVDSAGPTCSFTTDTAGVYQVSVAPHTEAGTGTANQLPVTVVLAAPTGTVGAVTVDTTLGSGTVDLSWPQLSAAGFGYGTSRSYAVTVTGVTTTGGNCTSVADSASPSCSFTATTAGPFTVTVKAVNEAGTAASGTSDSSGNIVFRPAVAVTSLTAAQNIVTSPTVQVSWDSLQAADWQGGASKKYRVTVTPPSGQVTSDLCEAHDIDDSGSPSCTFDAGVGGDYGITVKPVNEAGLSTASAASASVHVVVVPTVTVTGLHVVTTPGSPDVTVVWNRATDFNGAVSTHNYLVTLTSPDGASLSNNDCTTVVDNVLPLCGFTTTVGGTYTASVALANEAGTGPSSATSSAVLALVGPTAAVTNLTVSSTPGSGTVQVGWIGLGASDWQGLTHHYNVAVTSAPNGAILSSNTCTVLASSDATAATGCSFATDTAGGYAVTVTAVNEAAASGSVATQSGHVTLVAPTGPVVNLSVSAPAGSPTVTATWDQLAVGAWQSGAIKTYTVVVTSPNGANLTNNTCTSVVDSAGPTCSFTTDTAGVYQVSVAPHTEAGTGTANQLPVTVVLAAPTGTVGAVTVDTTLGSGTVDLSWPQLSAAGFGYGTSRSYAVTVTGVTTTGGNCTSVADSASPSCSFTATTAGPFTVTVKAVNELGINPNGTDADGNLSFAPTAAQVGNLDADAPTGSATAQVSWDQLAGGDWQGGTNRRYAVSVTVPNGATLSDDSCDGTVPDGLNPGCSFTGSVSGTYTVHVTPVTEAGSGTEATLDIPVMFGTPSAATGVTGVAGSNAIQVSWTGPDIAHQGSGLTAYAVTATATGYPTVACPAPVASSPCTIPSLAAGVAYTLHVVVNGVAGDSAEALGGATVTPTGNPVAPTAVPNSAVQVGSATASTHGTVTITGSGFASGSTVLLTFFSVPVALGTATASPAGAINATVNVPAGATNGAHTLLATGLDPNGAVRYLYDSLFVVPYVAPPPVNNPPVTQPPVVTAPTGVVGSLTARQPSASTRSVTVTWTAGSVSWGTGSSRSYLVAVDGPDNAAVTGTCTGTVAAGGTGCTFGTDTNGSYQVTVTAQTEAGSGSAASTSVTVSVPVVPGAPTAVTGKASANAIAVSWTAPATPGAVITGYTVTATSPSYPNRGCAGSVTRSPCTISGLSGGVGYRLQVVATSKAGNSPAAGSAATVVPGGSVAAPTSVPSWAVSAGSKTIAAGGKVSISGAGFKANAGIQLRFFPGGTNMGTDSANSSGAFSDTETIAKGTAAGSYTLLAFGLTPGNQARFIRLGVVVNGSKASSKNHHAHSATHTTASHSVGSHSVGSHSAGAHSAGGTGATRSTGVLSITGPAAGPVVLAGFVLLITGLGLMVPVRRRRTRR